MATYTSGQIRQGLPRTPGGAGWPDVPGAVTASGASVVVAESPANVVAPEPVPEASAAVAKPTVPATAEPAVSTPAVTAEAQEANPAAPAAQPETTSPAPGAVREVALRQGLPRVPGGDPWPPAGTVTVAAPAAAAGPTGSSVSASVAGETAAAAPSAQPEVSAAPVAEASTGPKHAEPGTAPATTPAAAAVETVSEEVTLRQGLPRVPGGDPWPPAGTVTVERAVAAAPAPAATETAPVVAEAAPESALAEAVAPSPAETAIAALGTKPDVDGAPVPAEPVAPVAKSEPAAPPAPAQAPTEAASAQPPPAATATPKPKPKPKREPVMIGSRTLGQWVKLAVLWAVGAVAAAGIIVLAARGVTTLPGVPEFMERYPGEYHLPEFVEPGFPWWARWAHFFNFFLMILIIRSGLLVRQQQKPDAFFTPKKGGKKVSIYLWLHTSLDVLWLLNGVIFVVLLFVSGHWARIIPTSWEVFPNAASAALQYLTLEWPVEDGWVNYNSLQQLMYFTVIFIAAPLAAITGVRMSEWWPKDAEKLNKAYPAPIARAIHFPVMLFFVLFILVHVFLVFTTGVLKNLNHMFAGTPEISWVGFWWFAAGLLVTAGVTWAARPLVLAPIAGAFGRVSER